jgi:hypothetical protein
LAWLHDGIDAHAGKPAFDTSHSTTPGVLTDQGGSMDNPYDAWWKTFLFGLVCLLLAAFFYSVFSDLEASGGTHRFPRILIVLYDIGGKWLVAAVLGVFGVLGVGFGVKQWIDER